jgi:hypothetical protein
VTAKSTKACFGVGFSPTKRQRFGYSMSFIYDTGCPSAPAQATLLRDLEFEMRDFSHLSAPDIRFYSDGMADMITFGNPEDYLEVL